jgi:hypothetical protein
MHIKLSVIKIFVIAGFGYLRQKFPNISDAKKKEWIFISHKWNNYLEDQDFSTKSNSTERRVQKATENACRNFLGNKKEENYSANVQGPISSHSAMGCNMSSNNQIFFLKTWEPSPSGYFPNWKEVQWKMESKYVGWLLLQSYTGDTN